MHVSIKARDSDVGYLKRLCVYFIQYMIQMCWRKPGTRHKHGQDFFLVPALYSGLHVCLTGEKDHSSISRGDINPFTAASGMASSIKQKMPNQMCGCYLLWDPL